ncbi:MAG: MBL fold metallo-hydrolase RNA specificity domain-containing protein [Nocardioidaceae bacterium]
MTSTTLPAGLLRLPATLRFLGAAGTVTGSRFLVDAEGARILVDCGLFQGPREWRRRNWDPMPLDPRSLDAVVLSHAHLDHCGYLPVLVREGYGGPVLCTPATSRLVSIVLRDSAHLQEEDAEQAREGGWSKHADPRPLYDSRDAERAVALLEPVTAEDRHALPGGAKLRLRSAGHILGSSFVELEAGGRRLLFSGDIGRPGHALLRPPEHPDDADVVVVESTYGNRHHGTNGDEVLADAVSRTVRRGGSVLLPAFAVDRTPVLLLTLARLLGEDRIPDVPVFVDSPMALAALEVYTDAVRSGDPEVRTDVALDRARFDPLRVRLAPTRAESERLNRPDQPCIIVSASGMATGGRVLHHLSHQLPDRRNCVVLTGFQVPGTRGRALQDGARELKIHGRYVPVTAEVVTAEGFSAHADAEQVLEWLSTIRPPSTAYVVHGEPEAASTLVDALHDRLGWTAVAPGYLEKVRLD